MKAIYNVKIITELGALDNHAVVFSGKISAVVPEPALQFYSLNEKIDAGGNYLAPGFIDIHIHGCAGADTMDKQDNALEIISEKLPRTGVTAFLPTTMTMDFALVKNTLERIRSKIGGGPGAEILGCHLEGPFINSDYKGAQDPQFITAPEFAKIRDFIDVIKLVTIAPEVPLSLAFIHEACASNIVVSIGHSAATYEQAMDAIGAGASHVTHTFNAMSAFNHRRPGILGALTDSNITCELIADNVHVHPAAQRLLLKLKGTDRVILVTDAMRACLMPNGDYDLGGQLVKVMDGTARLESGVIAGSVLTLDKAVANIKASSGLSISEIVKMVTINPARKLGIECDKGSIAPGRDADMVILDEGLTVLATFVKGKVIYRHNS